MNNGCITYLGSQLVTIILKFLAGELWAEISDYAVRHTKAAHISLDELDSSLSGGGPDWFNLHPLGKICRWRPKKIHNPPLTGGIFWWYPAPRLRTARRSRWSVLLEPAGGCSWNETGTPRRTEPRHVCSVLPFDKGSTTVLSATPWITDSTTVQNIVIIADSIIHYITDPDTLVFKPYKISLATWTSLNTGV
jgi:hypothetical protein